MSATQTQYITFQSRDGQPTQDDGFLRFCIDSNLRNVSVVEWLSMEIQPSNEQGCVINHHNDCLHFSEDLMFFRARLPHGEYVESTLLSALQAAMACAELVTPSTALSLPTPQNAYVIQIQSDRIAIRTRGPMPFAIHVFQGSIGIQSLRLLNSMEAHITFRWPSPEPMAKGSVIEVARPNDHPFVGHILYTSGTAIIVRFCHPCIVGEVVTSDDKWTMRPLQYESGLPRLLGLGMTDLASWAPLRVVQSSTLMPGRRMVVGVERPHGLTVGDPLVMDGFAGSLVNGKNALVERNLSDHHLEVSVGIPADEFVLHDQQMLRFSLPRMAEEVTVVVDKVISVISEGTTTYVKVQIATSGNVASMRQEQWYPIQMLSPIPSLEWAHGSVHCMWEGDRMIVFSLNFVHATNPETHMIRKAVVGPLKMSLFTQRQVILMRLRLGTREGYGVMCLQANNKHVFGRAQIRPEGLLSSTELGVVGHCSFYPPLERVPYVEVAFMTHDGQILSPAALGNYSILLRCRVSS